MKIKITVVTLIMFLVFSFTSQAQIWGTVQKSVQKKGEQKVENALEKRINNAIDEATADDEEVEEEATETKSQAEIDEENAKRQEKLNNAFLKAMGSGTPIHTEKSYSFNSSMTINSKSINADQEIEESNFTSYFNKDTKSYALDFKAIDKETNEPVNSFLIYDVTNSAMLIISQKNNEKSGIVTPISPDDFKETETENQEAEEATEYRGRYKKTGKTKNICGYKCDEYEYIDEKVESTLWTTTELEYDFNDAFGQINSESWLAKDPNAPEGFIMEINENDLQEKSTWNMQVTDINKNEKKTIDVSDYQLITIGNFEAQDNK